jgi:hypothetical protein
MPLARLRVHVTQLWSDGSVGGHEAERTVSTDDPAAIGRFLIERADAWIGEEGDGAECDALDVTVVRAKD